MAKKSLTDLLREEVEKSSDPGGEKIQKTTDDELLEQDSESVETLTMKTPAKSIARRPTTTKAELEATVTKLRAALEEAQHKEETFDSLKEALDESHRKEGSLQQQISDLHSDLEHERKSVHKLEKQLEQIDQLKKELDQAKKAAVQLAAANEKLIEEVKTLKKQNEDVKPKEKMTLNHMPERPNHMPERPIQKETETPVDFATKSWLL
jgi:chromosome segregation ATPase